MDIRYLRSGDAGRCRFLNSLSTRFFVISMCH